MRYIIAAPSFSHKSAGIVVLYELQKWLVKYGKDAVILNFKAPFKPLDDDIVIYPEIVKGNPLKARKVVRYILNVPGKLGGDTKYDENEILFAFDETLQEYSNGNVLRVPTFEEFFKDYGYERSIDCFWIGKGPFTQHPVTENCFEITYQWPPTRRELAELLNHTRTFYTYDDKTSLSTEAKMCGCEVKLIHDNKVAAHPELVFVDMDCFHEQLQKFIDLTWDEESEDKIKDNVTRRIRDFKTYQKSVKPPAPKVSVVMLTWNALEYTRKCVQSIQQHTAIPYEIIFTDNASSDGTQKYLDGLVRQNPNFKLVKNKENIGFAAGNNQGVKAAESEFVMLLNNDVLVSDGWLEGMLAVLEKDAAIGAVGPITNYISGLQRLAEVPYRDDDDAAFHHFAWQVKSKNAGKITPRRRLAGFAMLMRKELYNALGGFDESFGSGNFEDDDLCLRIRQEGYALMVDESTYIHHFGSQTFKANKMDYSQSMQSRGRIFRKKWPKVDYDELLEMKNPLSEVHEKIFEEGAKTLELGEWQKAAEYFEQITLDNPIHEEALFGIALAARQNGDSEKALHQINRLMGLNPNHTGALNLSGLYAAEMGDIDGALMLFRKCKKLDSNFLEARRNLAELLFAAEDESGGKSEFNEILKDTGEDVYTLTRLCQLFIEKEDIQASLSYAKRLLEADPSNELAELILKNQN